MPMKKPRPSGAQSLPDAARSDGLFEILGRAESDFLAGFDLDAFAGRRVAPLTRRPLTHLENAQAVEADAFALLEMLGDVHDHISEHSVRLGLRGAMTLGQSDCQMTESNRLRFGALLHGSNPGNARFDLLHVLPSAVIALMNCRKRIDSIEISAFLDFA